MKTCIVIPTYNERENIVPVVAAIKSVGIPNLSLLFVDDNSPDGTAEAIRRTSVDEPWVHLLSRDSKMGIGSAYRDGFGHALDTIGPDVLVEMDADLQHPPQALPELLHAIEEGADVAVASRYIPGGGIAEWGRGRRLVSRVANVYARTMLGLSVRDCTSGIRAYTSEPARMIVNAKLPAKGFEFQVATLFLLKTGMKIAEVPYFFGARRSGRSKLGIRDILKFSFSVLAMSLRRGFMHKPPQS